ncbi:sensor histidine kinase [Alteromonas sp. a30]|uniref:sensor histidine kinase n=1 Tax=Alteromonas sp. a30 TaxID=2730917 RepID=UPI00227DBCED|nr:PAS domain-containing sensor histidine kinase [Alteromonas sp. a30]MCY7296716.1 PAS domain-containing sensor histidine kinase [Alteromonas sp. a30]
MRSEKVVAVIGALGVSFALMVLISYPLNLEILYRLTPNGPATHPITALCIFLLGITLIGAYYRKQRVIIITSSLVMTLCLLRMTDLGFNQLDIFIMTLVGKSEHVGQKGSLTISMGTNTAFMFFCTALSCLLYQQHAYKASQLIAYITIFLPFLSLKGHVLGLESFYGQMAVLTSVSGILLTVGSLLLSANHWIVKVLFGNSKSGQIARYQIISVFIFPMVFQFASGRFGFNMALHDLSVAISTMTFTWFVVTLICITAMMLNKQEASTLAALNRAMLNESKFKNIFNFSTIPKLMVDDKGRIVMANAALKNLLGYSEQDLDGFTIEKLIPQSIRESHIEQRNSFIHNASEQEKRAMNGGRLVNVLSKKGREIPVEIGLVRINTAEGKRVIAALQDRTQLQLQMKELERSNKELEQFAYVASHDLRSPLRTMANMAKFIEEDISEHLQGETKKFMDLLRQRIDRLEKLLVDLLDYSRVGRKESKPEWLDLNTNLKDICDLYVPSNRFHVQIEPDLPKVYLPQTLLQLVLRNLIMNAVKHHDKAEGNIRVWAEQNNCWLIVHVEDDGPGIPEEFRERVFQMFSTLKPKDKVEGSGMGLAVIHKVMQTIHGDISVTESELGGASFNITFPIPDNLENDYR